MPAERMHAVDGVALKRLKAEWQEQARNRLLNDLAAKLNEMERDAEGVVGGFIDGHREVIHHVRDWMNEQATTERQT